MSCFENGRMIYTKRNQSTSVARCTLVRTLHVFKFDWLLGKVDCLCVSFATESPAQISSVSLTKQRLASACNTISNAGDIQFSRLMGAYGLILKLTWMCYFRYNRMSKKKKDRARTDRS